MKKSLFKLSVCGLLLGSPIYSHAGESPLIGDVVLYATDYCPRGWVEADGRMINIYENNALFSIYGTFYGGDGRSTFGIPDLRGRVPVGTSSSINLGEKLGTESYVLTADKLPKHSHSLRASATDVEASTISDDEQSLIGTVGTNQRGFSKPTDTHHVEFADPMSETVVSTEGTPAQKIDNMPAYTVLRWCVATQGIYPARR